MDYKNIKYIISLVKCDNLSIEIELVDKNKNQIISLVFTLEEDINYDINIRKKSICYQKIFHFKDQEITLFNQKFKIYNKIINLEILKSLLNNCCLNNEQIIFIFTQNYVSDAINLISLYAKCMKYIIQKI